MLSPCQSIFEKFCIQIVRLFFFFFFCEVLSSIGAYKKILGHLHERSIVSENSVNLLGALYSFISFFLVFFFFGIFTVLRYITGHAILDGWVVFPPYRLKRYIDNILHVRQIPARILKLHLLKIAIAKECKVSLV